MKNKILYATVLIIVIVFVILIWSINSCWFWGDNNLGNNFSLLEGDCIEDRAVIYCTTKRNDKDDCCYGGIAVIPLHSQQYNSEGNYSEYVEKAISNNKWIIVKSYKIEEKKFRFWILNTELSRELKKGDFNIGNLDSVISAFVVGPLDQRVFIKTKERLRIGLNFP